MTRKHFQALAAALKSVRPEPMSCPQFIGWRNAVLSVADTCADANPRFDHARFTTACGGIWTEKD